MENIKVEKLYCTVQDLIEILGKFPSNYEIDGDVFAPSGLKVVVESSEHYDNKVKITFKDMKDRETEVFS